MSEFIGMEPTNLSFKVLLSNGTNYNVPRFQRDYAWQNSQWEELWTDIEQLDIEQYHYMGYIVLQQKGSQTFEVIDGQQRLVTLTLIIIAGMSKIQDLINNGIEQQQNKQRLALLNNQFIGYRNPVSLTVSNKIILNKNNNDYFKDICNHLLAKNRLKITTTNKLLFNCFQYFYHKDMGNSGKNIAELIEKIADSMIFTKITVKDEINAYKIFETLNARGIQLSTPDLIKNYLFSLASGNENITEQEMVELDKSWTKIIDELGMNNFSDFICDHHNMQKKKAVKSKLFSSIKQIAQDAETAYQYINSLSHYASIYAALLSPRDDWWQREAHNSNDFKDQRIRYLEAISIFGITQPIQVLMIGYDKFSPHEFIKLARYIYILSIRYNAVGQKSPYIQEAAYNKIAINIFNGTFTKARDVKNSTEYKKILPSDQEFRGSFESMKIKSGTQSNKKAKFFLNEIERYLGGNPSNQEAILEHICPQNLNQNWPAFASQSEEQYALGNMILLESDHLGGCSFTEKRKNYKKSSFLLANKVAQYREWTPAIVQQQQRWLAEQAVKIWGF